MAFSCLGMADQLTFIWFPQRGMLGELVLNPNSTIRYQESNFIVTYCILFYELHFWRKCLTTHCSMIWDALMSLYLYRIFYSLVYLFALMSDSSYSNWLILSDWLSIFSSRYLLDHPHISLKITKIVSKTITSFKCYNMKGTVSSINNNRFASSNVTW